VCDNDNIPIKLLHLWLSCDGAKCQTNCHKLGQKEKEKKCRQNRTKKERSTERERERNDIKRTN
jgi:hypothetical protein